MTFINFSLISAALLATCALADNFAVLVAGSDGYYNYRHQSDVGRAYNLFRDNGFPEENIIVMHKDDIANSRSNPFPGKVFNEIGGEDVYHDLPKHYTGEDVTPANFLKVLSGAKVEGKPVLKTTEEDNIFVYFTDHGAPGLIAFPSSYLYADKLIATLKGMYEAKKYKTMVFYLEACESGSMFNGLLPADWNIYAHTAATPFESSYACDYDNKVGTFLNDCWSRNWMRDTDKSDVDVRTLTQQFDAVHESTTDSTTCAYGNLTMADDIMASHMTGKLHHKTSSPSFSGDMSSRDMVSSRDVVLETLKRQLANNKGGSTSLVSDLEREILSRSTADLFFAQLAKNVPSNVVNQIVVSSDCKNRLVTDYSCLRQSITAYTNVFGQFTDYSLKYVNDIYNLCQPESGVESIEVVSAINNLAATFKETAAFRALLKQE